MNYKLAAYIIEINLLKNYVINSYNIYYYVITNFFINFVAVTKVCFLLNKFLAEDAW